MIHLEEERRTGGFSCASKLVYNYVIYVLRGKVNKFLQLSLFLLFLWCFKDRRKMKEKLENLNKLKGVWLRSAVFCENIDCTGVFFF